MSFTPVFVPMTIIVVLVFPGFSLPNDERISPTVFTKS